MKYRLVAIDLDGTLLNDRKEIPEENKKILRELNSLGVEIVIATGRRYWSAKKITEELGIDLVIVANNGNIIRKISDDKVLVTKYLNREDFNILVKEGRKRGLYPVVHVNHFEDGYDFVIELERDDKRYSSYFTKDETRYRIVKDLTEFESHKVLVTCYTGDYGILSRFQQHILKAYPDKYNTHIMESTSIGAILEFMNPLGSKWLSLREYAHSKGIKTEEILAIGDDNNDIEMIRKAGLGIGMKNGIQKVKDAADLITDKINNESGVADILTKIFKL